MYIQQSKNDGPYKHAYVKCKQKRNAPSKDADSLGDIADEIFVCLFVFALLQNEVLGKGKIKKNVFQVRKMTW